MGEIGPIEAFGALEAGSFWVPGSLGPWEVSGPRGFPGPGDVWDPLPAPRIRSHFGWGTYQSPVAGRAQSPHFVLLSLTAMAHEHEGLGDAAAALWIAALVTAVAWCEGMGYMAAILVAAACVFCFFFCMSSDPAQEEGSWKDFGERWDDDDTFRWLN